ncbi:MAG: YjgP/YjgQ family permease [Coraliomargarita sp. TMED73]|nr:MAG: YjgP/YjgQ family permease [Coraliomargarita sp. TMED73]
MSLFARYIFKEWATAFALVIGMVLGILVLQNMYDTLPDLLNARAEASAILIYYALSVPGYLPAVLPISFLVSILFSMGNLHRNHEITAMRATGASLLRISRPLWLVGLLLTALLFYMTAQVIPTTVRQARVYLENLQYSAKEAALDAKQVGLLYNLGFDNRSEDRLWFMNRFSARAWLAMGGNVHTRTEDGREFSRISAEEAYFEESRGCWIFLRGRELEIDPLTGDEQRLLFFEEKAFPEFTEDPSIMLAMHKEPSELSLLELRQVIETVPAEENPAVNSYLTRYFSVLAAPFSCLVVVGIAMPLSVRGVRVSPMVAISKCIAYFAAFYLFVSICNILGERSILPAIAAASLPNVLMLLVSLWLFHKSR